MTMLKRRLPTFPATPTIVPKEREIVFGSSSTNFCSRSATSLSRTYRPIASSRSESRAAYPGMSSASSPTWVTSGGITSRANRIAMPSAATKIRPTARPRERPRRSMKRTAGSSPIASTAAISTRITMLITDHSASRIAETAAIVSATRAQ